MATVRLSDVVIPEVFLSYTSLNLPELTEFLQAGILATNGTLNGAAKNGGQMFTMPFWQDLDPTIEPNYSNDDPDDMATPQKVGTGQMTARKSFLNQGWSDMDLVVELSGSDPMRHIASRVDTYWLRQLQRRLIATTVGVFNDNIANDSGDMAIQAPTEQFNADLVIDASGTLGDASGGLRAIAVHSRIRDRMLKNDEIVWVPDSQGRLTIATYKGLRVIVDDSMPIISGSGTTSVYLSVLYGGGAFGFGGVEGHSFAFGEGIPKTPVEMERVAAAGAGGGMETLWTRKTWAIHPLGFTWVEPSGGTALVEMSPTLADLRRADVWDRVVNRKQVPMAFITSLA
ncbi:MAG: hypothetical protein M0P09_01300 [Acholeplasmataceae bacterium]|nr:hypothetical protein [Acholeplasmataceae bacterium]